MQRKKMSSKETLTERKKVWKQPALKVLDIQSTKSGLVDSNQENKNHYVFGGAAAS
ncbi:hypothetical protein WCX18_06320 [Sulfurimonas sp. HSL1-2]|uniref:hypothetical protein n=1 Tax=Thiomicrolovo zhangzhouensis TaxID=3131933 RepID=UPI0031F7A309